MLSRTGWWRWLREGVCTFFLSAGVFVGAAVGGVVSGVVPVVDDPVIFVVGVDTWGGFLRFSLFAVEIMGVCPRRLASRSATGVSKAPWVSGSFIRSSKRPAIWSSVSDQIAVSG
ncbi:hypothetical protein [Corynebacterium sp.]|uniref:hypothetical protein n=1 Tax=Corynebacterium sp. TaxID=1720 RepID=UPI0025C7155F|nr:hypothetical protein [Corynebacterium sp.]